MNDEYYDISKITSINDQGGIFHNISWKTFVGKEIICFEEDYNIILAGWYFINQPYLKEKLDMELKCEIEEYNIEDTEKQVKTNIISTSKVIIDNFSKNTKKWWSLRDMEYHIYYLNRYEEILNKQTISKGYYYFSPIQTESLENIKNENFETSYLDRHEENLKMRIRPYFLSPIKAKSSEIIKKENYETKVPWTFIKKNTLYKISISLRTLPNKIKLLKSRDILLRFIISKESFEIPLENLKFFNKKNKVSNCFEIIKNNYVTDLCPLDPKTISNRARKFNIEKKYMKTCMKWRSISGEGLECNIFLTDEEKKNSVEKFCSKNKKDHLIDCECQLFVPIERQIIPEDPKCTYYKCINLPNLRYIVDNRNKVCPQKNSEILQEEKLTKKEIDFYGYNFRKKTDTNNLMLLKKHKINTIIIIIIIIVFILIFCFVL